MLVKICQINVGYGASSYFNFQLSSIFYLNSSGELCIALDDGNIDYFSNGNIMKVGYSHFEYFSHGGVMRISNTYTGTVSFDYYSSNALMYILTDRRINFEYYSDGKLMRIYGAPTGTMTFNYYSDGRIMRIDGSPNGTMYF